MLGGIKTVWETLANLPSLIANALKGLFDDVVTAITSLPQLILDGIKSIFVPDMDEMKAEFSNLLNTLSPSLAVDSEGLFPSTTEKEPTDVYYTFDSALVTIENVKIVDYSFLKQGVDFFRPIINGFLLWMLGWYWYKEFLSFIGQAPNMASAENAATDSVRKGI